MMATTIYAGLMWNAFSLLIKPVAVDPSELAKLAYLKKLRFIGVGLIHCLILNMFTGALVAGIGAGEVYNTWPLMNGQVIPKKAFEKEPWWKNFFENRALVQFNHRNMAYITESISIYLLYTVLKNKIHHPASFAGVLAFALINYQAASGIITLLNLVPREKANMHQMTAIITFTSGLLLLYLTRVPRLPIAMPKVTTPPPL